MRMPFYRKDWRNSLTTRYSKNNDSKLTRYNIKRLHPLVFVKIEALLEEIEQDDESSAANTKTIK